MTRRRSIRMSGFVAIALLLSFPTLPFAQQGVQTADTGVVPRLVTFSGILRDAQGQLLQGVVGATFSLYRDQQGGAPLWTENQNVRLDESGRYSLLLGATRASGLPTDLFISAEQRWLGVQAQLPGEPEQPRVLLVSVPYALKAADADTLGGFPASAFMPASPDGISGRGSSDALSRAVSAKIDNTKTNTQSALSSNGPNTLAKWDNAGTNLVNSVVVDNNGNVGIGTSSASQRLVVTGTGSNVWAQFDAGTGFNSGSIYSENNIPKGYLYHPAGTADLRFADGNGGNKVTLQLGTGNLGIGTNTPGQRLVVTGSGGNVWSQFDAATGFNSGSIYSENDVPKGYLYHPAGTADLRFADGKGADKVTVQLGTGNVGIGTNNPAAKLDVAGDLKVSGNILGTLNLNAGTVNLNAGGALQINGSPFVSNFGTDNTYLGSNAGNMSMDARENTATGSSALHSNTTGGGNTASGYSALSQNTTGAGNTASGYFALFENTTGSANTASGEFAMYGNTTGNTNTASGYAALFENTTGSDNTALGDFALDQNRTGSNNTALGDFAGFTTNINNANRTGSNNTFIGYNSGPGTAVEIDNATAIGANALVSASNTLVLGAPGVSVAIGASTAATTLQVAGNIRVGTSGTNGCIQGFGGSAIAGTCSSDMRLKRDIEPFVSVLDKVTQLEPVSYNWNTDEHPEYHFGGERTQGLIAQDVEKVFPNMVSTDERGYKAVNYSQLPLLLLQALRELKTNSDSTIHEQQSQIQELKTEIEALKLRLDHRN